MPCVESVQAAIGLAKLCPHLDEPNLSYHDLENIDGVLVYQGRLKLVVGIRYTENLLRFLAARDAWPRLQEVDCKLTISSVRVLFEVIVTRQERASDALFTEQYKAALGDARSTLDAHQLPTHMNDHLLEMLSFIRCFILRKSSTPLYSPVHWKIHVPDCIPKGVVAWLRAAQRRCAATAKCIASKQPLLPPTHHKTLSAPSCVTASSTLLDGSHQNLLYYSTLSPLSL